MKPKFKTVLTLLVVALLAVAIAGCGEDDSTSASTESDAAMKKEEAMKMKEDAAMKKEEAMKMKEEAAMKKESGAAMKAGQTKIQLGSVDPYGKILQNGDGKTIYLFTKEKTSKSECYDECADAWPPVTTKESAFAGSGVSASKLGTTKRTDGTTQVTYNDHPLYYYVDETQPDQVLCQAVDEFGGIWYVVDKNGDEITTQ